MLTDLRDALGLDAAPGDGDGDGDAEREALRLAQLRVSTALKLPDCCVLDAAIENGADIATFHDALAHAARERGLSVHP